MGTGSETDRTRIEFIGGPKDGDWETVKAPPNTHYMIEKAMGVPFLAYHEYSEPIEVTRRIGVYRLGGWFAEGMGSKECDMVYVWEGEYLE